MRFALVLVAAAACSHKSDPVNKTPPPSAMPLHADAAAPTSDADRGDVHWDVEMQGDVAISEEQFAKRATNALFNWCQPANAKSTPVWMTITKMNVMKRDDVDGSAVWDIEALFSTASYDARHGSPLHYEISADYKRIKPTNKAAAELCELTLERWSELKERGSDDP